MPGMIDGLLAYSQSGFTQPAPSMHTLSEIVNAATRPLDESFRTASAHLIVLRESDLWCDFGLMVSVFQNLIANSLKNRRKDRQLVIRIDAEVDDGMILISVEDNGVGFDPEFAAVAFNPLARGVRTAGEGAGIGLATCRTIIQGHGGTIRVDPTHKGGARIEFTLPITNGPIAGG
jgi:signal transduction histidine kinase